MDNLVHIEVDITARVNIAHLNEVLAKSLQEQQAVYAVVGTIMGTTEHGAVDPLYD
jgi:glutamate/tyrosine decarboxylase-like PLP-dependent enzyme